MSFDGYLCLGGLEIINSSRVSQMIAAGKGPEGIQCRDCAPCPDLDKGLGYPSGYNPSENPWYDPAQPESIDFAGLLVTSITGLEPGQFQRPVTETAGVGAIIGQGRQVAPQVVVTGLLMAATCCAAEYGLRWLSWALRQSCTPGALCAGTDLVFLSCEPTFPDEDCGEQDFPALLAPYFRTLRNAALVDGPFVSNIVPRACPTCHECALKEVTFTLSAGDPCIYRDPVLIVEDATFDCSTDQQGDCITWVVDTDGSCLGTSECDDSADCSTDPDCVDVSPPAMPSIVNPCVDDCIGGLVCRICADIPQGIFPATGEGTLQISIFAGDMPMRKIQIKIWENPLGLDPIDLDDCDVCTVLNVSYVGTDATLVIDGANRSSTISCPGGSDIRANPFIATGSGVGAFSYPSLSGCGGPYTVCVTAGGPVSTLATVTISAIPKEC